MKIRFIIIILCFTYKLSLAQICDSLLIQSITNPGPNNIDHINQSDGMRNSAYYSDATIFYPINLLGIEPLTSIIMIPGYANTQSTINNWGIYFASHGIAAMTLETNSLLDSHTQRRDALLDALITLKQENFRFSSPLFLNLDTNSVAVGGFSKGGGGAQLSAVNNPNIKAVVALYPWLDNPMPNELNHNVPVLIISGELDVIAPPYAHADIHYNYTPSSTNKLKYEIQNASHDVISGPYGGGGFAGIIALSWLKTYLIGDTCYCPILLNTPNTASDYDHNITCDNINTDIINFKKERKLINTFDVFGRIVSADKKNQLLLYLYNDGYIEKKIHTR